MNNLSKFNKNQLSVNETNKIDGGSPTAAAAGSTLTVFYIRIIFIIGG